LNKIYTTLVTEKRLYPIRFALTPPPPKKLFAPAL
jgi:hypothetical protein